MIRRPAELIRKSPGNRIPPVANLFEALAGALL
jgi:hypothetical protein